MFHSIVGKTANTYVTLPNVFTRQTYLPVFISSFLLLDVLIEAHCHALSCGRCRLEILV